jgi:hypothetical protein
MMIGGSDFGSVASQHEVLVTRLLSIITDDHHRRVAMLEALLSGSGEFHTALTELFTRQFLERGAVEELGDGMVLMDHPGAPPPRSLPLPARTLLHLRHPDAGDLEHYAYVSFLILLGWQSEPHGGGVTVMIGSPCRGTSTLRRPTPLRGRPP